MNKPFALTLVLVIFFGNIVKAQSILDSFKISPSQFGSQPLSLFDFNNTLLFHATDDTAGRLIRKTDGLYFPVKITMPNLYNGYSSEYFAKAGTKAYFAMYKSPPTGAYDATAYLVEYDGVSIPKPITLIDNKGDTIFIQDISNLVTLNDWICFNTYDTNKHQKGLCAYNSKTGKVVLTDSIYMRNKPFIFDNKVYFQGPHNYQGINLCEFDPNQNHIQFNYVPNTAWVLTVEGYFTYNNTLFFFDQTGRIYFYDKNTMSIPASNDNLYTPAPSAFAFERDTAQKPSYCQWGNDMYFAASVNGNSEYLYKYNFPNLQTTLIDTSFHEFDEMILYANKLFFVAISKTNTYLKELYMYDGINPPILVADINTQRSSFPYDLTVCNNRLFFGAMGTTTGTELYVYYDPTSSIKNARVNIDVTAFPNPVTNTLFLNIEITKPYKVYVTLTDIQGRDFYKSEARTYYSGNNLIEISMQNAICGTYYYTIKEANGSILASGKVLKQ